MTTITIVDTHTITGMTMYTRRPRPTCMARTAATIMRTKRRTTTPRKPMPMTNTSTTRVAGMTMDRVTTTVTDTSIEFLPLKP